MWKSFILQLNDPFGDAQKQAALKFSGRQENIRGEAEILKFGNYVKVDFFTDIFQEIYQNIYKE